MLNKKAHKVQVERSLMGNQNLIVKDNSTDAAHNQAKRIIPEELKERKQWFLWKYGKQDENGKKKKIPCDYGGRPLDEWQTGKFCKMLNEAVKEWKGNPLASPHIKGVGFLFTKDDPYFGIDVDGCLDIDEILKEEYGLVLDFDTYIEISPSGKGLHIIGKLKDKNKYPNSLNNNNVGFETYTANRFFTITGKVFQGHYQLKDCSKYFETFTEVVHQFKQRLNSQLNTTPRVSQQGIERNLRTYDAIWFEYWESVRPRAIQVKSKPYLYEYPLRVGRSPKRLIWDVNRKRPHDNAGLEERDLLISEFGEGTEVVEAFDKLEAKKLGNEQVDSEIETDTPKTLIRIFDEELAEDTYLVDKLIPNGLVTLVAGDGGIGKTYVGLALASALSHGGGFPIIGDGESKDTILFTREGTKFSLRERLKKLGSGNTCFIDMNSHSFVGKKGLSELASYISSVNTGLVIIDSASYYCGGLELEKRTHVVKFLDGLNLVAKAYNIPILLYAHCNKGTGSPLQRIQGSAAMHQHPRSVLVIDWHPDKSEHRVITQVKENEGRASSLEFKIDADTGIYAWIGQSTITSEDLGENGLVARASKFLLELTLKYESVPTLWAKDQCKEVYSGLSDSQYQRAKTKAGFTKEAGTLIEVSTLKESQWHLVHPDKIKNLRENEESRAKQILSKSNVVSMKTKKFA